MSGHPPYPKDAKSVETRINLDSLLRQLYDVNESNMDEILAFKQNLQNRLAFGSEGCPRVTAAAKLPRPEILSYFGLKNADYDIYKSTGSSFPYFQPTIEFPGGPSDWLASSLNQGSDVFCQSRKAYAPTFINLIIMDVTHHLPRFQHSSMFKPEGRRDAQKPDIAASQWPKTKPKPMPFIPPLNINVYHDISLSSTITTDGSRICIASRFDTAFTTSQMYPDPATGSQTFLGPYLAVLEMKGAYTDLEVATNQLTACLATIYHSRARLLQHHNIIGPHCTSYGLLSDGLKYWFLFLDDRMIVHRSMEKTITHELPQILQYFRHIFAAIAASRPIDLLPDDKHPDPNVGNDSGSDSEVEVRIDD